MSIANYKEDISFVYIDSIVRLNLNPSDQEIYFQAAFACDKCFNLAKQQKITEAKNAYEIACSFFEKASVIIYPWITAFCGPRLAYYHYKMKRYDQAVNLTWQVIASLKKIEQKNNYRYLFFPRIQQLHNLSRIYFAIGKNKDAILLCSEALLSIVENSIYLESDLLINGIPENEFITATKYDMLIQVLLETSSNILFKCSENTVTYMNFFLNPLIKYRFSLISDDPRYESIDKFISIIMLMVNDDEEIDENDIIFFIKNAHADKALFRVLCKYVSRESCQVVAA